MITTDEKIKISDLPELDSLDGFYTIGSKIVNGQPRSYKVTLPAIENAASVAAAAAGLASEAAEAAKAAAGLARSAADLANGKAALVADVVSRAINAIAVSEQDHLTAQADHMQAGSDHAGAESDHALASADHLVATEDHSLASSDHASASSDHSRAESDHTLAESDHTQAETDHATAAEDHSIAQSDHTASQSATEAANAAAEAAAEAVETMEGTYAKQDDMYDAIFPTPVTSMPADGFKADTVYDLGTLSGNINFLLADGVSGKRYCWAFETPSTLPAVAFPAGIKWSNDASHAEVMPELASSMRYEVSIVDGYALISEFDLISEDE